MKKMLKMTIKIESEDDLITVCDVLNSNPVFTDWEIIESEED